MSSKLRFGVVNESGPGGPAWLDHVRRVEDGGIDVFLVRDHFSAGAYGQQLAPFSALAAAATVTPVAGVDSLETTLIPGPGPDCCARRAR